MKYLLLLFVLVSFSTIQAQNNTFGSGEKLVYTASYKMSGLMTDLAQVTMQTSEVKTSKSTLYKLKCTARTFSKWDGFFKIDDLYESYINPTTLNPYLYKRDISEGGYYKFMKYNFNHKTKTVKSLKRKKNREGKFWEEKKNLSIGNRTKDLVSTLYYLRNLDIHKAQIGATDNFTILFDNKETKINFTYLGKETINTNLGKKECYKIGLSIAGNSILKGNNSNSIWLTADANKIPVYAKFKVAVGSGELRIKSATGLKN
jgi:hypothetical protein